MKLLLEIQLEVRLELCGLKLFEEKINLGMQFLL
jgi:hypothetical protein